MLSDSFRYGRDLCPCKPYRNRPLGTLSDGSPGVSPTQEISLMYQQKKYKITGVSPLILHNGRLANPLDEYTRKIKELTGKKDKTEADYEEMARLEWYGGLYTDKGQICIPGEIFEATFVNGAKKRKRGPQAKAGVYCDTNFTLIFDGQNGNKPDFKKLYDSGKYAFTAKAKVKQSSVMRTRPRFDQWEFIATVHFDDKMLNPSEIF